MGVGCQPRCHWHSVCFIKRKLMLYLGFSLWEKGECKTWNNSWPSKVSEMPHTES